MSTVCMSTARRSTVCRSTKYGAISLAIVQTGNVERFEVVGSSLNARRRGPRAHQSRLKLLPVSEGAPRLHLRPPLPLQLPLVSLHHRPPRRLPRLRRPAPPLQQHQHVAQRRGSLLSGRPRSGVGQPVGRGEGGVRWDEVARACEQLSCHARLIARAKEKKKIIITGRFSKR